MDLAWIKEVIAVVAQHGPWAVLAYWLILQHFKRGDAQTAAMVKTAKVLERLAGKLGYPIEDHDDDEKAKP